MDKSYEPATDLLRLYGTIILQRGKIHVLFYQGEKIGKVGFSPE